MKLYRVVIAIFLLLGYLQADVHSNESKTELTGELYGSRGNAEAEIEATISKIGMIGFSTVAANKHIEVHYYNKFQEKGVEMTSFFYVVNKEKIRPLLLKTPISVPMHLSTFSSTKHSTQKKTTTPGMGISRQIRCSISSERKTPRHVMPSKRW